MPQLFLAHTVGHLLKGRFVPLVQVHYVYVDLAQNSHCQELDLMVDAAL